MGGAVSGYLDSPVTDKEVEDGVSKLGLKYGGASMQGWRNANEDALSCEPHFTDDSALFAVYDGHGGPEIALYVAKYLPILLKTQYDFTSGKTEHALREAFLAVDKQITLDETVDELQTLAGTKCDDDDDNDPDGKLKECEELHEEASMPLTDLLAKYKKQMADCIAEEMAANPEKFEGSGKGKGKKAKPEGEEKEEAAAAVDETTAEKAAAVDKTDGEKEEEEKDAVNGAVDEGGSATNGKAGGMAGTANGEVTEEEEGDEEYEEEEEEEEEEDSEEETDDEDGSGSDEDSDEEEEEMCPYDEREGYGSGTTACVALIRNNTLTVANVGDSRCVICTGGKAADLSEDHKPENEAEKARVEKAGGRITKDGRVNGGLNLSRALGDHQYKANEELAPQDQLISPMPDMQTHNITEEDEFMMVACDGVWNVLSSQEAVDFVRELMQEAKAKESCSKTWLSDIVGKLLDRCMAADTRGDGTGCDNMTCVIVLLNQDTQSKRKLVTEDKTHDNSSTSPQTKKSKTS